MRLVKMLGLAAVAAMAATAFVGATPASATSTQLCNSHTSLTCSNAATSLNSQNDDTVYYLSSIVDIECDDVDSTATPLALANPQVEHFSGLDLASCETSGGDACAVSMLEEPTTNLLKTGLDAGTITATSGEALVECEDVFFGTDLHCVYDAVGILFTIGAQRLTAENTQVDKVSGTHCPDETFLTGLLKTTGGNRYVLA